MYKENLPVFRQLDGTYGLERGSKGKTLTPTSQRPLVDVHI